MNMVGPLKLGKKMKNLIDFLAKKYLYRKGRNNIIETDLIRSMRAFASRGKSWFSLHFLFFISTPFFGEAFERDRDNY